MLPRRPFLVMITHELIRALALVIFAAPPNVTFAAGSDALQAAVMAYTRQAIAQIDSARDSARRMREAATYDNAEAARRAWIESHAAWEQSETFTLSLYPDLYEAIDGWPANASGYHAIESALFAGQLSDITPGVDQLVDGLEELSQALRSHGLTPQGLLNGTIRLAMVTAEHKAAGNESPASGTSLDDIVNNVQGLRTVFTMVIGPTLRIQDPDLFQTALEQLNQMEALLHTSNLRSLDRARYSKAAEGFATTLRAAAPVLGLKLLAVGH